MWTGALAVVVVAAVVTVVLVLSKKPTPTADPGTAVPPVGSTATGASRTIRPFPDLPGDSGGSGSVISDGSPTGTTGAVPRSSESAPSGGATSNGGSAGGQAEARQVATSWIAALNAHDLTDVQAQLCAKTAALFTRAFVNSIVPGSMKLIGVTTGDSTGTVSFEYQLTPDKVAKSGHLSMVIEGGGWKVCQ